MDSRQYFGIPVENIRAAEAQGVAQKFYRINARVPSRKEVATLPVRQLRPLLTDWMCHSATEIIPSKTQIYDVIDVLRKREDFAELEDVTKMCRNYLADQ